jgi:putative aldouronate transport system substrate-binding protein
MGKIMNSTAIRKIMVVYILLAITVTGCSHNSNKNKNTELPASIKHLNFEEHLDISIGFWNIDNLANSNNTDTLMQYLEELFNITIHPVSFTWSNYKERYQILSATKSLPDVFATVTLSSSDNNDSASLNDMVKNGSIRSLPEDLSSYPLLEALMKSVSYTRNSDGSFYTIPRMSFMDPVLGATDAVMLVRRDWMDNLGLKDPETFNDFLTMTTAFAKEDPDGNGINDTIGYNVNKLSALGKWVMLGLAPECNVYTWTEINGEYVPSWSTENFKKVVTAYRELYEAGGLDPDFYSKSTSAVMEDFASSRLGALEYKSSPPALLELKTLWDSLNDKSFEECVDIVPIFPASDGIRYSNSSSIFWSESLISSAASDAKVERILALYEYLLSEEGIELSHYGIPEVDYTKTEDGYRMLIDTGEETLKNTLIEKYPSYTLFSSLAAWGGGGGWSDFEDTPLNNLQYGSASVKLARKSALWNSENTVLVSRPYEFLMYPKVPTDVFSTSQAFNTFVKCIIGTDNPVKMWENYINQLKAQGFDEYIKQQNDIYNSR